MLCIFANERLNFGSKYLKFGWEFAQHMGKNFENFEIYWFLETMFGQFQM